MHGPYMANAWPAQSDDELAQSILKPLRCAPAEKRENPGKIDKNRLAQSGDNIPIEAGNSIMNTNQILLHYPF